MGIVFVVFRAIGAAIAPVGQVHLRQDAEHGVAEGEAVGVHGVDGHAERGAGLLERNVVEKVQLVVAHPGVRDQQPLAEILPAQLRDEVLPERIPSAGLIILRDGQPGEPEVTLSPLHYHYQHRAELEVIIQAPNGRASAFNTLIAAIGTALEADRTLGGLCDWVEPEAPASVDLPVEGAAALKAAVITVVLHYTTTGPLA